MDAAARGGMVSVFGVETMRITGATDLLMGDPVATPAGLAGTELIDVEGSTRRLFVRASVLAGRVTGDCIFSDAFVAAAISSLPGCCRFAGEMGEAGGAVVEDVSFTTFGCSFLGLVSTVVAVFFPVVFGLGVSFVAGSGTDFLSFCSCFFWLIALSEAFLLASPGVCGLTIVDLDFAPTGGVSGGVFVLTVSIVAVSAVSAGCLLFFDLIGVASLVGVAGITGTAGVMVEEVVRDIGRDPGREKVSVITALGMAGAVNPGGTVGVALRGCSKKLPLIGVLGAPWAGSLSGSLTSASTLKETCSSALKGASSARTS